MTYAELKELPSDKRLIMLRTMGEKFKKEDGSPDFKQMAQELDTSTMAVVGMYSREVNGMKAGRKKTETDQTEIKQEEIITEPKKRGRPKQEKIVDMPIKEEVKQEPVKEEIKAEYIVDKKPLERLEFKTSINGTMGYEETQQRLVGVSNSLLKDKNYKVSMIIEEV